MVDVQVYGPTTTIGAFGLSGSTTMLGVLCPSEVSTVPDAVRCVGTEWDLTLDGTWRGTRIGLEVGLPFDDEDRMSALSKEERVLELKGGVEVDDDRVAGFEEVGTATGQKDHTLRPWSQKRSISNLRNPTASKLERQMPKSSSSYRR